MKEKINIAEILKDKPNGIKLYSPIFGDCTFCYIKDESSDICVRRPYNEVSYFNFDGVYHTGEECLLFPSNEMRDWEKFAWKRGDVLIMDGCRAVFDKWINDNYTRFNAIHLITSSGGYFDKPLQNRYTPISNFITKYWRKMTDLETKIYMESLEMECGGKLNLTTLNIEKQPEFKDGDIAFADYGNRQDVFIVSGKTNLSEGYYSFIVLNLSSTKALSIGFKKSFFKKNLNTIRLATEEEKKQLFDALANDGKAWDAEKKDLVDLKQKVELKPFDKVLVRDSQSDKWSVNLFGYIDKDEYYHCVFANWAYCIPYIGNESLLGTTKDVEG